MQYKVYVRCYTYNQASYIVDALNGFTMQQTDFPYVCIIVDDASTDGEPDVIKQYLADHFDLDDDGIRRFEETDDYYLIYARHKTNLNCFFIVLLLKYNHYHKKLKAPYFEEWTKDVKYVALCEGDDFWTEPWKLQKQICYLETHPNCYMTACSALWRTGSLETLRGCQKDFECDLNTDEVIRKGGYYLSTASLVFRSSLTREWPLWRKKASVGDFPLQILGSLKGPLHFFPDTMCVYRYMVEGSFSDRNKVWPASFLKNKIEWMRLLDQDTSHLYSKAIYFNLFNSCYRKLFKSGEIGLAKCLFILLKSDRKVFNANKLWEDVKDILHNKRSCIFRIRRERGVS